MMLALVAVSVPARGDWPQFRGPLGNASSEDAATPLIWSEGENIAWKTALPGRGASSPIVMGDRIFLTAYTGYGISEEDPGDKSKLRLHVLALNRRTGKIEWDRSIAASDATQAMSRRIADHGYATSTPVTDGEAVYACFGVSGMIAYDWDGNLMWQADVGTGTAGFGSASSPVLFENLVIINASIESDTAYAFDKKTGKRAWQIPDVKRAWTTPCLARTSTGEWEMVINQKDIIRGFDPRTGRQLWECLGIDDYIVPVPVSHAGIVYCLGGRKNRSIAIRLGGRGDVTETHKLWEVNIGANVTSPVFLDGHLYWSSDKAIANCLQSDTGDDVYRERLPTRSRIYASIVRAGDKLYVTTRDKGVLVLSATPEYKELARNVIADDDNLINASPAISQNQLFLRSDAFLYCIGEK